MKQFVIMENQRFQLADEHIEWLRKNGYPDAGRFFCEEDRSNPVLIQCIEAVRASKQKFVDEAKILYQDYSQKSSAMDGHQADYLSKQDEFLNAFYKVCNPCWKQGRTAILALREAMWENWSWEKFAHERIIFNGISDADLQRLMSLYDALSQSFSASKPAIEMCNTAREKFQAYCEEHNLRTYFDEVSVEDGFKIISYDETRFTAEVVCSWDYNNGSSENIRLIPYISRNTIYSFVTNGDTNGLMEYLRSLNSNISIEG